MNKARVDAGKMIVHDRRRIRRSPDVEHASYGPTLVDIVGREAGSAPGHHHSDALSHATIVWPPDALRAWIADNDGLTPGAKMRHVGVTDVAEQDVILAYLKSISNSRAAAAQYSRRPYFHASASGVTVSTS